MVFNCPSEGDSGSEAGVTHWQLMKGTPCRIWIIRAVGKLIVFHLRVWFAFVHASPPTGVTKKIPYGTLPIPAFPKSGKEQNPILVQGILNHVPLCSAVQNDEKNVPLAGHSPSQHFPSRRKKVPVKGNFFLVKNIVFN